MSIQLNKPVFLLWLGCVALVQACGSNAGAPDAAGDEVGRRLCEVSADCAPGMYCDLGRCFQACSIESACADGLSCTSRGACTQAGGSHRDAPPLAEAAPTLTLSESRVVFGPESDTQKVVLTPSSAIRYRVESSEPWLKVDTHPRDIDGPVEIELSLVGTPEAFEPEVATVTIYSSVGEDHVQVLYRKLRAGVVEGDMRYDAPLALGAVPVRAWLEPLDGQQIGLRIYAASSPTLRGPAGSDTRVLLNAENGREYRGSWTAKVEPRDLGEAQATVARDLYRTISVSLTLSEFGGWTGTFEESWQGLFPEAVTVSGTLRLSPSTLRESEASELGAAAAPVVVPPPSPPTLASARRTLSAACLAYALDVTPGTEPCLSQPLNLTRTLACGRAVAANLPAPEVGSTAVVTTNVANAGEREFRTLAEVCDAELRSPAAHATQAVCAHPRRRDCGTGLFAATVYATLPEIAAITTPVPQAPAVATAAQREAAANAVADLVARSLSAEATAMNEALVEAFRAPFRGSATGDAPPAGVMRSKLARARDVGLGALAHVFQPSVLDALRGSTDNDNLALRRLGRVMAQLETARLELQSLALRQTESDKSALSEQADAALRASLVHHVALATLVGVRNAPGLPELADAQVALTRLTEANRRLRTDVDVLGFPEDYVEFLYDARDEGPRNATNFLQVLNKREEADLIPALADEALAREFIEKLDDNTETLRERLEQATSIANERLIELCGALPGNASAPDVERCGQTTGAVAAAGSRVSEAYRGMNRAEAAIEATEREIDIEKERAVQVALLRGEQREVVARKNEIVYSEAHKEEKARERKRWFKTIGNNILGVANIVGGVLTLNPPAIIAGVSMSTDLVTEVASIYDDKTAQKARLRTLRAEQQKEEQLRALDNVIEVVNDDARLETLAAQVETRQMEFYQTTEAILTAEIERNSLIEQASARHADLKFWQARLASGNLNDGTVRAVRDRAIAQAMRSRERALRGIYLAAKAFEYETNTPLPEIRARLIPALRTSDIKRFVDCLRGLFLDFGGTFGTPATRELELSVRDDLLVVGNELIDQETGQVYSPAERFRRMLLAPGNVGPRGETTLRFATTLQDGNGVLSADLCNNVVEGVRVKFVGDGLGDNQAAIRLGQTGASTLRTCDAFSGGQGDNVRDYMLPPTSAVLDVGVNDYRSEAYDTQLFGRAMANTAWTVSIPPGNIEPQNADLDLTRIEDIVLMVRHRGISLGNAALNYTPFCSAF